MRPRACAATTLVRAPAPRHPAHPAMGQARTQGLVRAACTAAKLQHAASVHARGAGGLPAPSLPPHAPPTRARVRPVATHAPRLQATSARTHPCHPYARGWTGEVWRRVLLHALASRSARGCAQAQCKVTFATRLDAHTSRTLRAPPLPRTRQFVHRQGARMCAAWHAWGARARALRVTFGGAKVPRSSKLVTPTGAGRVATPSTRSLRLPMCAHGVPRVWTPQLHASPTSCAGWRAVAPNFGHTRGAHRCAPTARAGRRTRTQTACRRRTTCLGARRAWLATLQAACTLARVPAAGWPRGVACRGWRGCARVGLRGCAHTRTHAARGTRTLPTAFRGVRVPAACPPA